MRNRLAIALTVLALAAALTAWFLAARAQRLRDEARRAEDAAARAEREVREAEAARKAREQARLAEEAAAREVAERTEAERLAREQTGEAARAAPRSWVELAERNAAWVQARECAVDAFMEGIEMDRAGDAEGAAAAYLRALAKSGDVAGAWTNLAILLGRAGRHDDAAVAAGMAVGLPASIDPRRRAHAMSILAGAEGRAGRHEEALQWHGRAMDADPLHAPTALRAAAAWSDAGDPDRAIVALSAIHDAGAADRSVESFLAVSHWHRGDMRQSAHHAEAALRLDPRDVDSQALLAHAQLALGRWPEAAAGLERAIAARESDADLHAALAYAYERLGRASAAAREYDRAISLEPSHPTAHAHRGAMLEASGQVDEARAAYRQADAAGASKARSAAQTKLAVHEFLAGNVEAARDLAGRAVGSDAGNAHARFVLGVAALRLGDRVTAESQLQSLVGVDAERAEELARLLAGGPG